MRTPEPFSALELIKQMRRNTLKNYAVPGIESSLLGGGDAGTVRLFESTRQQQETVTPHSHRFNFSCLVLEGVVGNRIWTPSDKGDQFMVSELIYGGAPGNYDQVTKCVERFDFADYTHGRGGWYSMSHDEIHSIWFSRGTKVLFFEGPAVSDQSLILEPYVNYEHIRTFEQKEWMFQPV